jgi:FkbM family methyltransferase
MIDYFKSKIEKRKIKRNFKIYGVEILTIRSNIYGDFEYAKWNNPLYKMKPLTDDFLKFLQSYIKKGDLVIDIGANIGDTTVPFALVAQKEGLVLGIDPNPHVFKVLEENAQLNTDKSRILPLCAAITQEEGEFYYNSSEATFCNGGISSEKKNKHGRFCLDYKIKGIKLEKYLNENHSDLLDKLSFIKIDTEGYDKEIIRSISGIISKYKPYIICECFKRLTKLERFEYFDLIASNGYILYYLDGFYEKPIIGQQIQKQDMMNWKHFDIFAKPKGE